MLPDFWYILATRAGLRTCGARSAPGHRSLERGGSRSFAGGQWLSFFSHAAIKARDDTCGKYYVTKHRYSLSKVVRGGGNESAQTFTRLLSCRCPRTVKGSVPNHAYRRGAGPLVFSIPVCTRTGYGEPLHESGCAAFLTGNSPLDTTYAGENATLITISRTPTEALFGLR